MRPEATIPGSCSGTWPKSGTRRVPGRAAGGPPGGATSSTTSRTKPAAEPACATRIRSAGSTTGSNSTRGGRPRPCPAGTCGGPCHRDASTSPSRPGIPLRPLVRAALDAPARHESVAFGGSHGFLQDPPHRDGSQRGDLRGIVELRRRVEYLTVVMGDLEADLAARDRQRYPEPVQGDPGHGNLAYPDGAGQLEDQPPQRVAPRHRGKHAERVSRASLLHHDRDQP